MQHPHQTGVRGPLSSVNTNSSCDTRTLAHAFHSAELPPQTQQANCRFAPYSTARQTLLFAAAAGSSLQAIRRAARLLQYFMSRQCRGAEDVIISGALSGADLWRAGRRGGDGGTRDCARGVGRRTEFGRGEETGQAGLFVGLEGGFSGRWGEGLVGRRGETELSEGDVGLGGADLELGEAEAETQRFGVLVGC